MADFNDWIWGGRGAAGGAPGTSHHWAPLPGDVGGHVPAAHEELAARLADTRRSLHSVAELLLAGPQHVASHTIRLAVVPCGFATVADPQVRVDGSDLVVGDERYPLSGTYAHLASQAGLTATPLTDVYKDGLGTDPHERMHVDDAAARHIENALFAGDLALREFAPMENPVLWPEHFDIAVTSHDITYGVSTGDATIAVPYAYISLSDAPSGDFWNQSFGAARPLTELAGPHELVGYFTEGRDRAAQRGE